MSLRKLLRKWLGVPTIATQRDYTGEFEKALTKALDKLDRSFTQRIARFTVVNCIVCGEGLIAGRDAIYTNFKGTKFCSHKCIADHREES